MVEGNSHPYASAMQRIFHTALYEAESMETSPLGFPLFPAVGSGWGGMGGARSLGLADPVDHVVWELPWVSLPDCCVGLPD